MLLGLVQNCQSGVYALPEILANKDVAGGVLNL